MDNEGWITLVPTPPRGVMPFPDAAIPRDVFPVPGLVSNPTSGQGGDPYSLVVLDKATGELTVIDRRISRICRMRKRLSRWGDVAGDLVRQGKAELIGVTLTYAPGRGWRKRDVSEYVRRVRRHLGKRLIGQGWVAELMRNRSSREAVHYMLYFLVVPGTRIPKPDDSGMWPHGFSRVERNRRGIGYAMKYAQKVEQKGGDFPRGLRLFAVHYSKGAPVPVSMRRWFRMSVVPRYVEAEWIGCLDPERDFPKRAVGGGWDWEGQHLDSPYLVRVVRNVRY